MLWESQLSVGLAVIGLAVGDNVVGHSVGLLHLVW